MKYRAMDADGDYRFGRQGSFLTDSPEAVAQAVQTRLQLWTGEWFLDDREGTPYNESIFGFASQGARDQVIKERVARTPGVRSIVNYSSSINAERKMMVTLTIDTIYGQTTFTATGI